MNRKLHFAIALLAVVLMLFPARVYATNATAGYDLFETDPQTTSFTFAEEFTIPSSFFDPGSDPFTGTVQFKGVQIGSFNGQFAGTADTVVQRKVDAVLPAVGSSATVPIELVMLSLTSVNPITVTYSGGSSELWDVSAAVSPSRPSSGTMTVTHELPDGGTFQAQFTVFPLLTFTRQSDAAQRQIDVGALNLPQSSIDKITLRSFSVPWTHTCPSPVLQSAQLNPDFCASATPAGKELTREEAALARHGVFPANRQPKPVGGIAFSINDPSVLVTYLAAVIAVVAVAGLAYAKKGLLRRAFPHFPAV